MVDELDDDHPLWLVNAQIEGLLEGFGANEDHENVLAFFRLTGLPESTVKRMHKAIVCAERGRATPDEQRVADACADYVRSGNHDDDPYIIANNIQLGAWKDYAVPAGYTAEELERDNPFNQWMYEK